MKGFFVYLAVFWQYLILSECFLRESDYSVVSKVDTAHLNLPADYEAVGLNFLGHFHRGQNPKYTVILLNGALGERYAKEMTKTLYLKLIYHLDHYDTDFSDNVQLLSPHWFKLAEHLPIHSCSLTRIAFKTGRLPKKPFFKSIASVIAYIRRMYRIGVIPSLEKTAIYGYCLGGIVALGAGLGLGIPLGGIAVNGGALYSSVEVKKYFFTESALDTPFWFVHGRSDAIINNDLIFDTVSTLQVWGVTAHSYLVEGGHDAVLVKHIYTAYRWIASTLTGRPEIYRPKDSDNAFLIAKTKRKVLRSNIIPIVHNVSSETDESDDDIDTIVSAKLPRLASVLPGSPVNDTISADFVKLSLADFLK